MYVYIHAYICIYIGILAIKLEGKLYSLGIVPAQKAFATYEQMGERYSVEYLKHMVFVCISSKCLRNVNNLYLYTVVTMNTLFCFNKKCIYKQAVKH